MPFALRWEGLETGWLQVISDFHDLDEEFAMLRRVIERSRRPIAITILQNDHRPDGRGAVFSTISPRRTVRAFR